MLVVDSGKKKVWEQSNDDDNGSGDGDKYGGRYHKKITRRQRRQTGPALRDRDPSTLR